MEIAVQCECGQKFGVSIDDKLYKQKNYTGSFMGKGRCTNPDCNLTVYVNAEVNCGTGPDEDLINPKIDWECIKEGEEIYFENNLYRVAYKYMWSVQNTKLEDVPTRILYLHSFAYRGNIIVEVRESGFMTLFNPSKFKTIEKGTDMWTNVELIAIKKRHERLDNVG